MGKTRKQYGLYMKRCDTRVCETYKLDWYICDIHNLK